MQLTASVAPLMPKTDKSPWSIKAKVMHLPEDVDSYADAAEPSMLCILASAAGYKVEPADSVLKHDCSSESPDKFWIGFVRELLGDHLIVRLGASDGAILDGVMAARVLII